MENVAEALKIAFGIMMFVIALTMSISSFSQANEAIGSIIEMRDREIDYTYVQPTKELSRMVSAETIVPMMYKAYKENIEIYFFDKDGKKPLIIYYATDELGKRKTDDLGNVIGINYINLEKEGFGNEGTKLASEVADEHLDILLGPRPTNSDEKYYEQFKYKDGLYKFLSENSFEERLGEYYQGTGASKIKKRVISYILQ